MQNANPRSEVSFFSRDGKRERQNLYDTADFLSILSSWAVMPSDERRVNRQVQIRLFVWRTLLLVFQTWVYCLCLLLFFSVCSTSFYLWDHRNWLNILSDEFITRISDEAKKNARYENVPCVKPYIMSDVQIIVIRLGLEPKTHTLKVYCSTSWASGSPTIENKIRFPFYRILSRLRLQKYNKFLFPPNFAARKCVFAPICALRSYCSRLLSG